MSQAKRSPYWPSNGGLGHSLWLTWRDLTGLNSVWGVWLSLIPLMSFMVTPKRGFISLLGTVDTRYEAPEALGVTALAVVLGIGPAALTIVRRRLAPNLSIRPLVLFLWILTLITLSDMTIPDIGLKDFGLIGLGLFVFTLMIVMCSQRERTEDIVTPLLTTLAVFQVLVFLVVLADNNYVSGRFQGRLGPNYWGSAAASSLLASYAIRSPLVRAAVMLVCGYMLLVSENRSGELAAAVGSAYVGILFILRANTRQRLGVLVAGGLGFLALLVASPIIYSKVLLLDSERRGLDSGGTGRFAAWGQAFKLFSDHPILGVGYRHHEQYITVASSAHNAYLATAADMGLFGLTTYLVFLYGSLATATRKAVGSGEWASVVMAGMLAGYAAVNMLESRGINFANSVSLAIIACVALTWRANPPANGASTVTSDAGSPSPSGPVLQGAE